MFEGIAMVVVAAILVALAVHNIRRRARLTPEERHREDMLRETRAIKRELRNRRYD